MVFMEKYIFYFVSLSDGDASLRVRFIYSSSISNGNSPLAVSSGASVSFSALFYVIEGSVSFINKKITSGQAFYRAANSECEYMLDDENTKILVIGFDGIHSKKLLSDANVNTDIDEDIINVPTFSVVKEIYDELKNIYPKDASLETPQIMSQIAAKSYFYRLLRCLEKEYTIQLATSRRKLLVLAEEYMRNHFSENISIEDTSRYLSVNRRYLYKIFKKYSGISPKQYLNNIRISRATELLTDSDMSISEVAELTGYKDLLQFSTFFKKQTGLSPRKYRNSIQK